jgi:transcriptional antiterminator
LEWASQWLAQYKLRIFKTQRRGIEIFGDEIDRRNAIAGFFDICGSSEMSKFEEPQLLRRIDGENLNNLLGIYPRDTVLKIARIIDDAEREFDFILLDDFYASLLMHMVISVLRISNGNYVSDEFLPPEEAFSSLETETSEYIAQRIRRVLHVALPPAEKAYICIHLIGYNAFRMDQIWDVPFSQKAELLAVKLAEAVDRRLNTGFASDKMLFFGLCQHLRTTVYRLKVTSYASKTRRAEPSRDWLEIYEAIKASSGLYAQIFSVAADEEELLCLTCFFVLSQRRNRARVQAMLVSNLGIIHRMDLIRDIEQALPKVKIIDSCSLQQLGDWPNSAYAFVISTEPLPAGMPRPGVDLSEVPKNGYMQAIDAYVRKDIFYWQDRSARENA